MMALVRSMALVAIALRCLRFAAALEQETRLLRASDAVGSRKLLFDMSELESMGWDCEEVSNGGNYSWKCTPGGGGDGGDGNEGDEGDEGNEGDDGGNPSTNPTTNPTTNPAPTPTPSGSMALGDNVGKSMGSCGDPYVQAMVAADNASRGGRGALKCDEEMSKMAVDHSKAQCDQRNMGHQGYKDQDNECKGGSRCGRILGELGYSTTGENVLYHMDPLDSAVDQGHTNWMNSAGHKENIMKEAFTAVGYGFYVCANNDQRMDAPSIYMTGLFGG